MDSGGRHRPARAPPRMPASSGEAERGSRGRRAAREADGSSRGEAAVRSPPRISGGVRTRLARHLTLHLTRGATWGEQGRHLFGAQG